MDSIHAIDVFPDMYYTKLFAVPHLDDRPNGEIIESILRPPPVTSEQNVWAFWDKGDARARLDNSGPGPNYGSLANVFNFVDDAYLPKHLRDGKITGRLAGANISDTVRLSLAKLEVVVASADPALKSGIAENFFIAGRRGNGLIKH
ncbi:hypothetical protein F5Y19DRAFT_476396 [Xylariaceae sp. FL1651]|nr:hypothetical protein F5Y19DRAFT_476396 [Xylariaceae sp. FL1651]